VDLRLLSASVHGRASAPINAVVLAADDILTFGNVWSAIGALSRHTTIMSPPAHYDASAPSEQPLPAVPTPVERIASDCEFLAPRTRRGRGPGVLVIFAPPQGASRAVGVVELGVHVKLAEEGFAVVAAYPYDAPRVEDLLRVGVEKLAGHETVEPKGKIALLGQCNSACLCWMRPDDE
jgi:hypothetical protein